MARRSRMRFRFRKSFNLIPGILRWTVSRKSVSLNLNLGIFSKSWSNRGTSTTVDMPGTSGIFWRREKRRSKGSAAAAEVEAGQDGTASRAFAIFALVCGAIVASSHLGYDLSLGDCTRAGSPWITLAGIHGVMLITLLGLWWRVPALRGLGFVLLAAGAVALSWYGYGWFIADAINCR